jgi:hypothetical protein
LTLLEHQIRAGFWNINWLVVLTHWGSTLLETTNQRTIGGNNFQLFSNGTSSWCQKKLSKRVSQKGDLQNIYWTCANSIPHNLIGACVVKFYSYSLMQRF